MKDRLKVSVVLATYNGMKYIQEQLDSIKNQTYEADEVLIFDDGSLDLTCEYIQDYIKKNNLTWSLIQNPVNLGWQRNFIEGIQQAKGDIVFLADQDDIWHNQKIEIMLEQMKLNDNINLLACNYQKIHEDEVVEQKEYNVSLIKCRKQICDFSNVHMEYPGCTFCFKRSFYEQIRQVWIAKFPHDALLYWAAWLTDSFYICDATLHFFRRHANSASLKSADFSLIHRCERVKRTYSVLNAFEMNEKFSITNQYYSKVVNWLEIRCDFLLHKNIFAGIKVLKYHKFYSSLKTWGVDMLLVIRYKLFRGENN